MITPGYSLTAPERVLPRMALDFTTASLDSRVTVTRALNTATRVNSSGLIETVNADLPRFDFSPTSIGTCRGLLIEESRINIAPSSESFTTNWTALNATVSAAAGTSPTGANAAVKLVTANATTFQIRYWITTLTSGVTYVASVFAKAGEITRIGLGSANSGQVPQGNFNLITKVATSVAGSTVFIEDYPDGWYRCIAIRTATASGIDYPTIALQDASGNINFAGNGVNGALIWGYDFQVGAFATSYIPNTGTGTTTRNADVATMTSTNFSSWWQATTGAAAVRAQQKNISGIRPWLQFDDATADNIIALRGNTTNPELYIKATTDQAQIDVGTIAANTSYILTGGWNTDNCAAAISAEIPVTDTLATIPTVTQARLGNDGTNYLNGWLETIRYWPQRITNAEIQAFSKL